MPEPLIAMNKIAYVTGKKPEIPCILCGVVQADQKVVNLEIYRSKFCIVSANLYPFNPGHLMIFPIAHKIDIRQLTPDEQRDIFEMECICLDLLESEYKPRGFNIGYNIGHAGGASIDHLHLHITPRYGNEVGFLDILSGTRVLVEDPVETKNKLQKNFPKFIRS